MTEQTPEIVAAANLSPLSPSPIHAAPPAAPALPALHDQAEQLDVDSINRLAPAAALPAITPTMAAEPAPSEVPDAIVAGVAESDSSSSLDEIIDDDDSDVYGEAAEAGQGQNSNSEAGTDDYANTFDSPARQSDGPEAAAAQDVASSAPESMNSPSASATASHQPSVAAPLSADALSPSVPHEDARSLQPVYASLPLNAPGEPSSAAGLEPPRETASFQLPANEPPMQDVGVDDADADAAATTTVEEDDDAAAVDLQKLVADITAKAEAEAAAGHAATPVSPVVRPASPSPSAVGVNQSSSLPPRPTLTQEQSHAALGHPQSAQPTGPLPSVPPFTAAQAALNPSASYSTPDAHGTAAAVPSLPLPPSAAYPAAQPYASYPGAQTYPNPGPVLPTAPAASFGGSNDAYNVHQAFEAFLAEERKYMSEGKWERFPDGSRIFIGNLSSERVSKKDVFDLFHRYGRLAQISLKSAYGFVQYHTVQDAQAAMENLQGSEIKGRKIHLEYSRTQKKSGKDRENSPDRKNRAGGQGRGTDRYDGRDQGRRGRDEFRPNRSPSPRRNSYRGRDDAYGRGRGGHDQLDRSRKRSRSPDRYGRHDADQYRRRSPSPQSHARSDSDRLDIPRRYGGDVPDVQILLMPDVSQEFVDWVQRAFYDRGLRTSAMFLHPRFPREAVIQRQVLEGVHGVVELDIRAQSIGKIPLQVFDRSAGINKVRYDQYQDLDPTIAAELVVRTRGQSQAPPVQPPYGAYGAPYAAAPPQAYPGYMPTAAAAPPQHVAAGVPDLSGLVGHVDNTTLQTILAALQPTAPTPIPQAVPSMAQPAPTPPSQIDINAILSNLKSATSGGGAPATPLVPDYGMPPSYPGGGASNPGAAGGDPNQQVQNIMAQLARYRQ